MGFVRELISEIIDLPDAFKVTFDESNDITFLYYKIKYAIVNLIFQVIDCVIIPLLFYNLIIGNKNIGMIILMITLGLSTVFSFSQFLYYLLKPTKNYTTFFYQLLGETALGIFITSVFKIPIKYYTK